MNAPGSIPEPELGRHDARGTSETVSVQGSWTVRSVTSVTSTNAVLLAEAEAAASAGAPMGRTALMADHQTAGRGRLDRTWEAPAGVNLTVSMLFVGESLAPVALTQAVGVAAVAAVERLRKEQPAENGRGASAKNAGLLGLKWPNDVMFDGRKLAGVLAQRSSSADAIVVGIGCNVGWSPQGAASLHSDVQLDCSPRDLLDAMLVELDDLTSPERAESLTRDYRRRLLTLGQLVRVELPGDAVIIGRAEELADDGRLVVVEDGTGDRRMLDVGDIVHLRPTSR